jgi:PAS domain S-box-containing protein
MTQYNFLKQESKIQPFTPTENKLTMENMELTERLSLITQSVGIGIWDWELNNNKICWDNGMFKLFGINNQSNRETIDVWHSLIHPDEKERVANEIKKAIAGEQKFDTQFRIVSANNEVKIIKSKAFVTYDNFNKPQSMMGINWDITENTNALEKLSKSETIFRKIVETSQEGVWLHDDNNKTVFVNPKFTRIFGYSAKEMEYKNINDLIHPSFHDLVKTKTESRTIGISDTYEILCVAKNGTQIWVQVSASPIWNENKKYAGSLAMLSDITARKINEFEREKITNDLIQRNKNMEQFSYIVSHNLRAPLANILGCAELIKHGHVSNEELANITNGIVTSAQQLDEVIKDLNQILQIKNPLIEKRETVNLNEIVREIKNTIYDTVSLDNVTLKTEFDEVDKINSIKRFIYSIFYNLIHNSIKYQNPLVKPVIEIKSEQMDKGIKLTFKDNGSGIDLDKEGDKIFGLYKRFHQNTEGKGIGLFMVKTQVETIGGNIQIASELNKGTQFTIELPIAEAYNN